MRFAAAWLVAALSLISSLPFVSAGRYPPGEALYTNAVTYCAEPKSILIESFEIAYWRANSSVTFGFGFASMNPNLNTTAKLYLNAYGMQLFNRSENLCSFFSGVLCPLPTINFTGYGTYPIGDLAGQSVNIPSIAWNVPNLEAFARVELIDNSDQSIAACLQATLSNGWSTQNWRLKLITGMFTLATGLVALLHNLLFNSTSAALFRWFDVLFLYQAAASSGLMHLNYPLVYSNFAQNFAWSLGLFHNEHMQNSISKMRNATGGHLPDSAASEVQFINRKNSPYNELYASRFAMNISDMVTTPDEFTSFVQRLSTHDVGVGNSLTKRVTIPSTIDQDAASDLTTGIPVYINSNNIPHANALDTVFFFFLAFLAIVLASHVVIGIVVLTLARLTGRHSKVTSWVARLRKTWWSFCAANLIRTLLIFFFPLFIFGFYQWTIGKKDSGLSIFFSVLGMAMVFFPLVAVFILQLRKSRQQSYSHPNLSRLWTSWKFFQSVGILYRQYRLRYHWFWFVPVLLAMIARAAFIGFSQANGWVQVIGNIVVEGIVFLSMIILRPHKDRKGDWISAFLSFARLVMFGLLIAFIEGMKVKPIPRTVIGIVGIAVVGIATIVLLFNLIFNLFYFILYKRHQRSTEDGAELEFDEESDHKGSSTQVPVAMSNGGYTEEHISPDAARVLGVDETKDTQSATTSNRYAV